MPPSAVSPPASSQLSSSQALKPYPFPPPIFELLRLLPALAAPFLPNHILAADYPAAVQALLASHLLPLDTRLRHSLPQTKNWTHEFFTALLLSARHTLPTANKLSFLLAPLPGVVRREEAAARVLWAVGKWRATGYGGAKNMEVGWQVDGLMAGFVEPGVEMDRIFLADENETGEVVVWAGGRAWVVELFENGVVRSVEDLRAQLERIVEAVESDTTFSVAALSHRLERHQWTKVKEALDASPRNRPAMNTLYSSLITLSLEPYPLPTPMPASLDDIRGNADSPNRFPDQTLGAVVYADGRVGLTVDHTVADGSAGLELSRWLWQLAASPTDKPSTPPASAPTELHFSLETHDLVPALGHSPPPLVYQDTIRRVVHTTTLRLPRALHTSRLTDFCAQLALQAAVGDAVPIMQSVHQRHTLNARTDQMMAVTVESKNFLALPPTSSPLERQKAFLLALAARNERIKTKTHLFYRTMYLSPALSYLPPSPALEALQRVLHVTSGSPDGDASASGVQFTGFSVEGEGEVVAGLTNIYLEHQLAVFYLARVDVGEVEVAFSATGRWRGEVAGVVERFGVAWGEVVGVAKGL